MRPITVSEVMCFQRCEREWQHRYLDRREGLIAPESLSRGKRVHAALASWWSGRSPYLGDFPDVEQAMLCGYYATYQTPHLSGVRVNVPFRTTIGGVDVVGECDAVGEDADGGPVVVEHKTTTRDITPGSAYWREVTTCDPQVSTYLAALPGAKVLYDVLRVPGMKPLPANSKRKQPESDADYIARVLSDMAETREKYFQRAFVVRLDGEREAFAEDVLHIAAQMQHPMWVATYPGHPEARVHTVRNPKACFGFGRACDFFGVCWEGQSIESLPQREKNHSKEVLDRWEAERANRSR